MLSISIFMLTLSAFMTSLSSFMVSLRWGYEQEELKEEDMEQLFYIHFFKVAQFQTN